ncbi:hypothetical protein DP107_04390 [Haloglomus irregulare]|jgi:uncharacterized protein (DUF983 family)|uniref:C2H2-type domain-containing protein n=1 Tax=Haloglomus irregulare TaxID=2234134 RepID=A0A554NCI2_9EURY|nr:hypothetical protein [Haloglomus irregulare]TSD15099.1 hypothetical protein DP107_04390 [Haloglomus irregulare]
MERCSDCGEAFVFSVDLDEHRERCTGSPGDAVAGSFGDGSCPMCGTDYGEKGYLQHLAACDGAGEDKRLTTADSSEEPPADLPAKPAPTEVARHDTDRPNLGLVRSP